MDIKYKEIGICGLSCRLCPWFQKDKNKCGGCKSIYRMAVGCPFITCAIKKRGIEFCWDCPENKTCEKWKKHREYGKIKDSFKCYQTLETDISFILENGLEEFIKLQKIREKFLKEMLNDYNDGRSKSYYCIASTVLEIKELKETLEKARIKTQGMEIKEKALVLHSILDEIAKKKNYCLKLRK
jgi:hypothetical protein